MADECATRRRALRNVGVAPLEPRAHLDSRRIFRSPSALEDALHFAEHLLAQPNCTPIRPGNRHWSIFARLCREAEATGPLVPNAFFAALAIEHGCERITADRDYARFKDLRWRHPLAT